MQSIKSNPKLIHLFNLIISVVAVLALGANWLLIWCILLLLFLFKRVSFINRIVAPISTDFIKTSGFVLIFIIISRLFFWEVYNIPSTSMLPTLVPGDKILISKSVSGYRFPSTLNEIPLINIFYKLTNKKNKVPFDYKRYYGSTQISKKTTRGEILVFHNPQNHLINVKRCIGIPGDTIRIIQNEVYINEGRSEDYFIIPQKNQAIHLTKNNFSFYEYSIQFFEGKNCFSKNNQIYVDGTLANQFTFSEDYYFMLGDNDQTSTDSRHWGPVSANLIIGKPILIF